MAIYLSFKEIWRNRTKYFLFSLVIALISVLVLFTAGLGEGLATNNKEYLEKLGVECDLTITPHEVNFDKYDIVHLTDLTWVYDNIVYLEKLQKFNVKKVMSTIYWPFDDYAANGSPFIQKSLFKLFGINGYEFFKALGKFLIRKKAIYLKGLFSNYV